MAGFSIGETVGAYRITEQLGHGGMATVYRAYHANLDRDVALKVLHTFFKSEAGFLERFKREAQIVARLEHPNIVPIYDFSDHDGVAYLVMKFVKGQTLKARMDQGTLSMDEIVRIVRDVAAALDFAHSRDVLHRDIKPSNVLIDKQGQVYIADFGLARIASSGESTLSQDTLLGTPQYISPEQAQGARDLDPRTDVYSFGVMLYEMVVGRVPYTADTPIAIIHNHIYAPLPLPSTVNPNVSAAVERVLLKALAKDRNDRYPSASALANAFAQAAAAPYVPPIRPSFAEPKPTILLKTNPPSGKPAKRSGSGWLFGLAALAVLVVGAALIAVIQQNPQALIPTVAAIVGSPTAQPTQAPPSSPIVRTLPPTWTPAPTGTRPPTVTPLPTFTALPETAQPTRLIQRTPLLAAANADPLESLTLGALAILSEAQAMRLVETNPESAAAHFVLALVQNRINKISAAKASFELGAKLAKDDPILLAALIERLEAFLARSTSSALIFADALLNAYLYSAPRSIANHRNVAGQALYKYATSPTNALAIGEAFQVAVNETKTAELTALAALFLHTQGESRAAEATLKQAEALKSDTPEYTLVKGILAKDSRQLDLARTTLQRLATRTDWIGRKAAELLGEL
jgi:serine/threonine protein kinase